MGNRVDVEDAEAAMDRPLLNRFVLLVAALSVSGCSASYQVLRQADPNPFARETRFALMPLVGSGQPINQGLAESFRSELTAAVLPHLLLEPTDGFVHGGYTLKCRILSSASPRGPLTVPTSELTVEMRLLDSEGTILDEVTAAVSVNTVAVSSWEALLFGGSRQADTSGAISDAAEALGRYLLSRTGN